MLRVSIVGAGAWGSALAYALSKAGMETSIWSNNLKLVEEINREGRNSRYAGKTNLNLIKASSNLRSCIDNSDIVINALPSYAIREVFGKTNGFWKKDMIVINASKGIDAKTNQLPNQVLTELLPTNLHYFTLSGPGFAAGVFDNHPTTINLAGREHKRLTEFRKLAKESNIFFTFLSDVVGVEWGGIYKNIVAIGAGFASGLGYGENTNALVFSAGFKEMAQSGMEMGANLETFYEPSGVGDLMLSTSSMKSRNFSFGYYLAQTKSVELTFGKLAGVAEGYFTLKSVSFLRDKYGLNLPLANMLYGIVFKGAEHKKAFSGFLNEIFK